jgi:cytochrome b subunit of formate dehydrogenase
MKTLTVLILIITGVILVIYDAYAEYKNNDYTISSIIGHAALKNPIIPLLFGILMGHFFWSQCLH